MTDSEKYTRTYDESGVPGVVLESSRPLTTTDSNGEAVLTVPAAGAVHREIARRLLNKRRPLTGPEATFLRTHAFRSREDLAGTLGISLEPELLRMLEGEEIPPGDIPEQHETVLRLLDCTFRLVVAERASIRDLPHAAIARAVMTAEDPHPAATCLDPSPLRWKDFIRIDVDAIADTSPGL